MNASLHNADASNVKVNKFESFATVTVFDKDLNEVTLFFKNLAEVSDFALMINLKSRDAFKSSLS